MASDTVEADPRTLIELWREAVEHTSAFLRSLDPDDWDRPTDLPGWRVRDVVAHLAHFESVLAGHPQVQVEVGDAPHVHGEFGRYIEAGVLARAGRPPAQLVGEFVEAADARYGHLVEHPIDDPSGTSDGFGARLGWTWVTLLRNRVVDVWTHEQDVRRAVGRPGSLDTPAARHTAAMMAASLPFVLAKRARAAAGSSLVLDAMGEPGGRHVVLVGDDGRARLVDQAPDDPTLTLRLAAADWLALAAGRRAPQDVEVRVEGDADLGRRVLAGLSVMP